MATIHSIKSFVARHPAWTESAIRNLVQQASNNGLLAAGAIKKMGRKVLIVEEPFLEVVTGAKTRK